MFDTMPITLVARESGLACAWRRVCEGMDVQVIGNMDDEIDRATRDCLETAQQQPHRRWTS